AAGSRSAVASGWAWGGRGVYRQPCQAPPVCPGQPPAVVSGAGALFVCTPDSTARVFVPWVIQLTALRCRRRLSLASVAVIFASSATSPAAGAARFHGHRAPYSSICGAGV